VFNAIVGPDGKDQSLVDVPFNYDASVPLSQLRIGYLKADFDSARAGKVNNDVTLEKFRSLGAALVPIELPRRSTDDLSIILSAEAAAAFDELTLSNRDDLLVRQIKNAWPNAFREARFIPAVEYLQANRIRYQLIQDMGRVMEDVDVYIAPAFGGDNLLLTNLTGHPCVVLPNGFSEGGTPTSITLIGQLFGEANLLAAARAYQEATDHHLKHPPQFAVPE
jgi:Asp-tRNA(Asn)/Glu-tRNA(Gln) amidotransferase A subunit family amidase